jgi:hypothetical protein
MVEPLLDGPKGCGQTEYHRHRLCRDRRMSFDVDLIGVVLGRDRAVGNDREPGGTE